MGDRVGDTEDRLGELCLEQEHQISNINKLAKELASSTSFEPHLPKLLLPGLLKIRELIVYYTK